MGFPVVVGLNPGEEKRTSTVSHGRLLGTKGIDPFGNVYYWTKNGASAIEACQVVQTAVQASSSAHVAALDVVGATVSGVTTLTITIATTPITADQYKDGQVTIDTSPGQAVYRIKSNPAAASATGAEFILYPDDPLRTALTSGTTKVGLRKNPYQDVVEMPTAVTGVAVGVTPVAVAANAYFWAQTYGEAVVNTDVEPIAGRPVAVPAASPGTVAILTTVVQDIAVQIIGIPQTAGAGADKFNKVFLAIRA